MACPYPGCQGKVQPRESVGRCEVCSGPVVICRHCSMANRSFARQCRKCGKGVVFFSKVVDKITEESFAAFSHEARTISIPGEFWLSPLVFNGTLLCLSTTGALFSLFPGSVEYHNLCDFGVEFGKTPGVICETGPQKVPYFVAVSPSGLKAVNLINGEVQELFQASDGEVLLGDMSEEYATVAAKENSLIFLLRRAGKTFLASKEWGTDSVQTHELPEAKSFAGPLITGHGVAVYSPKNLYLLRDGGIKTISFPEGFQAWTTPGHDGNLDSPAGHLPHLTSTNAFYIPGHWRQEPTLLRFSSPSESAPLPLQEGVYSNGNPGQLLFSTRGEIRLYEQGGSIPVQSDSQLHGEQCVFADGNLATGFVKLGGGAEAVRFYSGNRKCDYPASRLGRRVNAMGFYPLGDSLALAFLDNLDLRVVVWDL